MSNQSINIDLLLNTADSARSLKEVKTSLRDLRDAALRAGEGTEEFHRLTAAAGQLQDRIGDVNARINVLADDFGQMKAAIGAVQGITGAFGLAQGAMAMFGVESKALQETFVKLQATMTILNSLQAIQNVLNKDSATTIYAKIAAQKLYNVVVGTSTGALKAFRIALAATGIGLAIVAIAALYENWDKLTGAIYSSTDALKMSKSEQEEYNKSVMMMNHYHTESLRLKDGLAGADKEQIKMKKELLNVQIDLMRAEYLRATANDKISDEEIDRLTKVYNEMINLRSDMSKRIEEIEKKEYEDRMKNHKKFLDDKLQQEKKAWKEFKEQMEYDRAMWVEGDTAWMAERMEKLKEHQDEQRDIIRTSTQASLADIESELDSFVPTFTEKLGALFQNIKENIDRIADVTHAGIGLMYSYGDVSANLTERRIQQLEKQGHSEEVMQQKRKELMLEQFKREKKIATISAIIQTALAVTKALNTQPFLPMGPIMAGVAALQGGAQIATIQTAPEPRFNRGGVVRGIGGEKDDLIDAKLSNGEVVINANSAKRYLPILSEINEAGGGVPFAPKFGQSSTTMQPTSFDTSRLEHLLEQMSDRPIRTYVVESELTETQRRVERIEERAKF
jgi:hypothetical protein